jgi:pyruvate formate lyase activating enzyme
MAKNKIMNKLKNNNSLGNISDDTAQALADSIPLKSPDPLPLQRREFLKLASFTCASYCASPMVQAIAIDDNTFPDDMQRFVREARHYEKLPHKKIKCVLCPRECVIDDRERGYCGVRENREGTYFTLVYSRPCTYHVDPIEKKPLFHFYPGSNAFSIATAGCNVNCKFCQNWEISQVRPEQIRSIYMPPKKSAQIAKNEDCLSIAYTYSEPTIFFEYMQDTAIAARERGVKSVIITAAYIAEKPLVELCHTVDAIIVDLKAFTEEYYRDVVNGELKPVLKSLEIIRKMNVWTEIVYLVVPTLNDSDRELRELSRWVKNFLGPDVPIHFTRFHPYYLLKNLPPTPVKTLERAKEIAVSEGINYVYVGNVPGHAAENTFCPKCNQPVVVRTGFMVRETMIKNGCCQNCNQEIAGQWGR